MGKRLAYMLLGFSIGLVVALVLGSVFGKRFGMAGVGFAVAFGAVAVAIAEWRGKVKSYDDLHRPETLFPRTPDRPPGTEQPK
jgi:predicted MFS family arabinose efflux permease